MLPLSPRATLAVCDAVMEKGEGDHVRTTTTAADARGHGRGAGYYAGKKIQEGREEQDAPISEPESQPAASGGLTDATIEQLKQLGELHDQGVLTDEEFDAQKQKLLQGS